MYMHTQGTELFWTGRVICHVGWPVQLDNAQLEYVFRTQRHLSDDWLSLAITFEHT
jgi:hypothetical protein